MRALVLKDREFTSFIDGKAKKFKIIRPNFTQNNRAELMYKKSFNEALREGIPTTAQLRDSLLAIEFFSKTSAKIFEIDTELTSLDDQLSRCDDKDSGLKLVLKMKELRAQRFIEGLKVNTIFDNTAENFADTVRNQFYVSELLQDENGRKVFSSFDSFKEKQGDQLAQDAIIHVMMFMARLEDNYQMEYPENKWLLKNSLINEDGSFIDENLFKEKPEEETAVLPSETISPLGNNVEVPKVE